MAAELLRIQRSPNSGTRLSDVHDDIRSRGLRAHLPSQLRSERGVMHYSTLYFNLKEEGAKRYRNLKCREDGSTAARETGGPHTTSRCRISMSPEQCSVLYSASNAELQASPQETDRGAAANAAPLLHSRRYDIRAFPLTFSTEALQQKLIAPAVPKLYHVDIPPVSEHTPERKMSAPPSLFCQERPTCRTRPKSGEI